MTGGVRGRGAGVVPVLLATLLTVVVLAAGAVAGVAAGRGLRHAQVPLPPLALPTGRPTPSDVAAATAVPSALPSPSTAAGSAPTVAAVAAALAEPLADPRLGGRALGQVVDLGTGTPLFRAGQGTGAAPASTAKIVTAAAVLTVFAAEDRITTSVVAGPTPGSVTLVGAGDPTLSAAAVGAPTTYAGAARMSDLAARVKAALGATAVTAVYVDGSAFTGPTTATGWAPEDAPSEYGAPITAAMVDGGRDTPTADVRSATPDLAAGQALAAALGVPDVPVARTGSATASSGKVVGSVQSAPISQLVEEMLKESDNVLAEVLARQVALEQGDPASFLGAAAAIRTVVPAVGSGMVDGSGLSVDDRLTAAGLTSVLGTIASTGSLRAVASDLPVAGWDGTLRDRFLTASESSGAGRVRAKTGTLTGVSSLAGLVVTRSGRVLAFAVLADRVDPTYDGTLQAESALDAVAAALCGLR